MAEAMETIRRLHLDTLILGKKRKSGIAKRTAKNIDVSTITHC